MGMARLRPAGEYVSHRISGQSAAAGTRLVLLCARGVVRWEGVVQPAVALGAGRAEEGPAVGLGACASGRGAAASIADHVLELEAPVASISAAASVSTAYWLKPRRAAGVPNRSDGSWVLVFIIELHRQIESLRRFELQFS